MQTYVKQNCNYVIHLLLVVFESERVDKKYF